MSMIPSSKPFEDALVLGENPSGVSRDVDWSETPKAHVFKADMTGLNNNEVKVEVEGGRVLLISGERNTQREAGNRVECTTGKFMRSFTLPANARMDQVRASMENGFLTVTIPKQDNIDSEAISN